MLDSGLSVFGTQHLSKGILPILIYQELCWLGMFGYTLPSAVVIW